METVKQYAFHKIQKLSRDDTRYALLKTIPTKIFNAVNNITYVILNERNMYNKCWFLCCSGTIGTFILNIGHYVDEDNTIIITRSEYIYRRPLCVC